MTPPLKALSIPWPAAPLTEADWRQRLEALATRAEGLVGQKITSTQTTAELALELVGLLWQTIGAPETVAATCRASLLLGAPGVVMAASPADQLQEVAERLDRIWEAAQSNPAAAVTEVRPPVLTAIEAPTPRPGRKRPSPAEIEAPTSTLPLEPEPIAAEPTPEPVQSLQRPARQLRPAHERMKPRVPAEPESRQESPHPQPEPNAGPVAPTPDAVPPTSWLTGGEAAELLGLTRATIANWRKDGRLGAEGDTWIRHGRRTYFDPAVIEQLERPEIPVGFAQLVAEIQAQ